MCVCDTKEELNEKEKFYISKYDTTNRDKGYNLTHGGDRPLVSEDTLRKMINSAKNKKKIPYLEILYINIYKIKKTRFRIRVVSLKN